MKPTNKRIDWLAIAAGILAAGGILTLTAICYFTLVLALAV